MIELEFPKQIEDFTQADEEPPEAEDWRFLAIEPPMKEVRGSETFLKQITVASSLAFKVWKLYRPLQITAIVLGIAVLALLAWSYESWWSTQIFSLTLGAIAITDIPQGRAGIE